MSNTLDTEKLEREVKSMYEDVAVSGQGDFHFETGRSLADRLGYTDLEFVPDSAIDSFAGVGNPFELAKIEPGETVLDLGSGSGMDLFVAALQVTETGSALGIDMTVAQIEKARQLATEHGFHNVDVRHGYIEDLPFADESVDVIISNGVINLSPEKEQVFREAYRVLSPGGRMAISDIISEDRMPDSIKDDADLWAACIGGAEQVDSYTDLIANAGLELDTVRDNTQYEFISDRATNACQTYGVKSASISAWKSR